MTLAAAARLARSAPPVLDPAHPAFDVRHMGDWLAVSGLRMAIIVLGCLVAVRIGWLIIARVERAAEKRLARGDGDAVRRARTIGQALRSWVAGLFLFLGVALTLREFGVDVGPLLASAGVVGVAIGFGAQSLVRDVIAGVFFLAEDAFRVGEYIEGAGNTKGNVERITLRSVALRHHNGPLHFVPYGALGSVRNTSRDWVIDKFNLPLPIEVESEAIRKMIKKVGEDMKADPLLGPMMLEPLKGKLYRIDPGVKIFRCKFRSPPGRQFDVRAGALKRIEAALKKMNLQFADGRQIAVLQPAPA